MLNSAAFVRKITATARNAGLKRAWWPSLWWLAQTPHSSTELPAGGAASCCCCYISRAYKGNPWLMGLSSAAPCWDRASKKHQKQFSKEIFLAVVLRYTVRGGFVLLFLKTYRTTCTGMSTPGYFWLPVLPWWKPAFSLDEKKCVVINLKDKFTRCHLRVLWLGLLFFIWIVYALGKNVS